MQVWSNANVTRMSNIPLCLLLLLLSFSDKLQADNVPMITNISTSETIMSGGIRMFVLGDSLNQFAVLLAINQDGVTESNDTLSPSYRQCQATNSTFMTCYTPRILHPVVTNNTLSTDMANYKFSTYFTYASNGTSNPLNNYPMAVYLDPLFKPFNPATMTFIANEDRTIAIEGVSELHGFNAADVTVRVGGVGVERGGGNCGDVFVNLTHVTCRPPNMKSDDITYGTEATFTLTVTITVGSTASQTIGKLEYTLDEPFSVIMIVMLSVLGFILIVSVLCGLLTVCGCNCGETESNTSVRSDISYESVDVAKPSHGATSARGGRGHARLNLAGDTTVDAMSAGTFRSLGKEAGVDNEGYENWSAGPGGKSSGAYAPVYETIGSEDAYRSRGGKV